MIAYFIIIYIFIYNVIIYNVIVLETVNSFISLLLLFFVERQAHKLNLKEIIMNLIQSFTTVIVFSAH